MVPFRELQGAGERVVLLVARRKCRNPQPFYVPNHIKQLNMDVSSPKHYLLEGDFNCQILHNIKEEKKYCMVFKILYKSEIYSEMTVCCCTYCLSVSKLNVI